MGGLDSNNDARIFLGHGRGRFGVHVRQVVFEARPAHTRSDDIQEREHSGFRTVDDVFFKIFEVLVAG